jgi:hypothetical protein
VSKLAAAVSIFLVTCGIVGNITQAVAGLLS